MTSHNYVQEAIPEFLTDEDPNERLTNHGPEGLRDAELLAILLGIPTTKAIRIIDENRIQLLTTPRAEMVKHVTPRQAARITAAIELSRRVLREGMGSKPCITSPADTLPHLAGIREQRKECFQVLCLNARNQVIRQETVSIGSLSSSIVHPREVFGLAIEHSAASLIIAHNHPSGDTTPSREDIDVTKRLQKAGEILGVEILDHIIISQEGFISLRDEGLL
jgi:DNA repair protein RadC